jgi:hypothetical protein
MADGSIGALIQRKIEATVYSLMHEIVIPNLANYLQGQRGIQISTAELTSIMDLPAPAPTPFPTMNTGGNRLPPKASPAGAAPIPGVIVGTEGACPHLFARGQGKGRVCGVKSAEGCQGYCKPHFATYQKKLTKEGAVPNGAAPIQNPTPQSIPSGAPGPQFQPQPFIANATQDGSRIITDCAAYPALVGIKLSPEGLAIGRQANGAQSALTLTPEVQSSLTAVGLKFAHTLPQVAIPVQAQPQYPQQVQPQAQPQAQPQYPQQVQPQYLQQPQAQPNPNVNQYQQAQYQQAQIAQWQAHQAQQSAGVTQSLIPPVPADGE